MLTLVIVLYISDVWGGKQHTGAVYVSTLSTNILAPHFYCTASIVIYLPIFYYCVIFYFIAFIMTVLCLYFICSGCSCYKDKLFVCVCNILGNKAHSYSDTG